MEVKYIIYNMKRNKQPGENGIMEEMLIKKGKILIKDIYECEYGKDVQKTEE